MEVSDKDQKCFQVQHALDRATFLLDQHRQHVRKLEEKIEEKCGVLASHRREALKEMVKETCSTMKTELSDMKQQIRGIERYVYDVCEKCMRRVLKTDFIHSE
ncbi:unnamed protein product, partial [Amoebophrya sp. A25]|eukprot:GSA25T00012969001.1